MTGTEKSNTAKPVDSRHGKIGLVHNTADGGAETRQRKIGSITEPVPQLGGSISGPKLPYGKTHVAITSTHRFNCPATMAIETLKRPQNTKNQKVYQLPPLSPTLKLSLPPRVELLSILMADSNRSFPLHKKTKHEALTPLAKFLIGFGSGRYEIREFIQYTNNTRTDYSLVVQKSQTLETDG
ncbi:hypothetical protein OUZ56_026717 [Daphnia magna]|uniref:Uncharacterized protein n=1 Tax=Daphnia magna TaxID=35525 RepID=A0ABQ9ZN00_9CRUS|nr:hypothetical protein OUZ56_026717 [Daphnia magna]